MNRQFDRNIASEPALNWRVLGLLNLYRVLVPLVLLGLSSLGGTRGIGVTSPQVFFGVAAFYLCFPRRGIFTAATVLFFQQQPVLEEL